MKTVFSKERVDELLRDMEIDDLNKASIRQIGAIARTLEEETGEEFIHFEMGIPGLPPSAVGTEAEIEALRRGVAAKYPNIEGIAELKTEASRFVKAFINTDVAPKGCIPTTGSMQGVFASFMLCTQLDPQRKTILYIDPGFPVQKMQAAVIGADMRSFDVADYRGAQALRAKLEEILSKGDVCCLIYSNPNNPSWMCLKDDELQVIGELATKYDVVVIEDLAYMTMDFRRPLDRPFQAPFQPSVSHYTDNYILMLSGSKMFSYAGQRIAVACISDKLFVRSYDTLHKRYGFSRFGAVFAYNMLYTLSSGVSHSAQCAMAAMMRAASDGTYRFVDDVREYARRTARIKQIMERYGFSVVYDKDQDEPVSDGLFFTIGYAGMEGGAFLRELLYFGITGIVLSTTGSTRQGIRACCSCMQEHHYPLLEERCRLFAESHPQG
ncbi:MAG: pyridoxal phosphate-dependent aminotransferase [Bacteroidaceae bacterium]|nr:pyridoxal phosphate-dependent aminotransferase [Bacteroidaceae bacterium]